VQLLAYLILYPILWFISILPFRLLYALSDLVYVLIYYVIGYRKKTVRGNLELALPHLSKEERLRIEKKSYQHLCDMFLEMIKTMSISREEIDKRFTYANLEVYKDLETKGKDIAVMCAHYASYEWIISMNHFVGHKGIAIYKKISNEYFDRLVKKIRFRFQASLITTKETGETIMYNKAHNILSVYGFASDQSPKLNKAHHWTSFMGINTPVHTGAEMLAKKYDMNMIYMGVKKLKRGHYQAHFEVLGENVQDIPNYEITDAFIKKVEKQILEAPEYYLWTHKRWKHRD
jgi:KDO2-lipid IV(A) lauroyltransferase